MGQRIVCMIVKVVDGMELEQPDIEMADDRVLLERYLASTSHPDYTDAVLRWYDTDKLAPFEIANGELPDRWMVLAPALEAV